MNYKHSKTNQQLNYLNARLDEIQMSDHERIMAKAQLARTEAVADAVVALGRGLRGLVRLLIVRPIQRMTASFS